MKLLRLIRVVAVLLLCIVAYAALYETLNAFVFRLSQPAGSWSELLGAPLWGLVFRAPRLLFMGTLPMLAIAAVFEWRSIQTKRPYLIWWAVAGIAAAFPFGVPLGQMIFLGRLMPLLVGAICGGFVGLLYWYLAGSSAGNFVKARNSFALKVLNGIALVAGAFIAVQMLGVAWYGVKALRVTISEPSPGSPPFVANSRRGLSVQQKVALLDFPDARSCLTQAERERETPDNSRMDWDLIDNSAEAEVCTFRLMSAYGGINSASKWFEAQGFKPQRIFTPTDPHPRPVDHLSISAGYSIKENGPKFPTKGYIRRWFGSIPYGMNVETEWTLDGTTLNKVRVSFST